MNNTKSKNYNIDDYESEIGGIHSDKLKKVLDYMNKKYSKLNEQFTVKRFDLPGVITPSEIYYLNCESMPDVTISVKPAEDGYKDNYMIHRFLLEYEKMMTPVYKEILGECKVFASSTNYCGKEITQDTTFEEYIKCDKCVVYVDVIATSSEAVEKTEELVRKLEALSIPQNAIFIKVLSDESRLSEINDMASLIRFEQENNKKYCHGIRIEVNKAYEITKSRVVNY